MKDERALKEELAELEAAARERQKRASNTSVAAQIGSDTIARKVKVLVLGDSGVGKSSIICRYISDSFNPSLVSTLGVDLKTKRLHVDDKTVQVQVWDTAGQTAFHKITTSYYKGSNAILLIYDISDRATLTNIEYWMKNIREQASESVQVALIGNKVDLRTRAGGSADCVRFEEGKAVADKYKVLYIETSAMTSGAEIEVAFEKIVRKVISADETSKNKNKSSDGSKSPEIGNIFSKSRQSVTDLPKNILHSTNSAEPADPQPVVPNDAKKKDCIIS